MLNVNLIEPYPEQVLSTFTPEFKFNMVENYGNVTYKLEVADNPAFTGAVEYSQIQNFIRPNFVGHFDGVVGASNFVDDSIFNLPLTVSATPPVFTDVHKKYGTTAAYSEMGTIRYIQSAYNMNFLFGKEPFTIETEARAEIVPSGFVTNARPYAVYTNVGGYTGLTLYVRHSPVLCVRLYVGVAGVILIDYTAQLAKSVNGVYRHICVTRDNDVDKTIRLFIDGELQNSFNGDFDFDPPDHGAGTFFLFNTNGSDISLWGDDYRVVKGICRYRADFMPPPVPYESDWIDGGVPGDVSEWSAPMYAAPDIASFTLPALRSLPENGEYYWRVTAYPGEYQDMILGVSETRRLVISGATFDWRVGLAGAEVVFKPSHNTVTIDTIKVGLQRIEKHIIRVDFAHMEKSKRDELFAEYLRRRALNFYDNMGNVYRVYWGECERSLNGTAHPPVKPVFGIDRTNMIAGALRWSGSAIFTEV